jgi:hypothetical protein
LWKQAGNMVNRLLTFVLSGKYRPGQESEGGVLGWFSYRKPRRLPPSDTEIRLRCLEASTRIAGTDLANATAATALAEDAMHIADVYFAYVKGISLRTNLRPVLQQKKPAANLQGANETDPGHEVAKFPRLR